MPKKATKENNLVQLLVVGFLALAVVVSLLAMQQFRSPVTKAQRPVQSVDPLSSVALTGNGSPAGEHYTLNIHAKKANWTSAETKEGGNNLFINENVLCKVNLVKDTTFFVKDGNCSDGVAEYHMPAPTTAEDPTNTLYSVFMRPLGKPQRGLTMQSCAMYDDDGDPTTAAVELCSTEKMSTVRMKGKSTFLNVSPELLSLVVSFDGGATYERVPLFDSTHTELNNYMWNTQGDAKLVQLRFYPGVMTALPQP